MKGGLPLLLLQVLTATEAPEAGAALQPQARCLSGPGALRPRLSEVTCENYHEVYRKGGAGWFSQNAASVVFQAGDGAHGTVWLSCSPRESRLVAGALCPSGEGPTGTRLRGPSSRGRPTGQRQV